MSRSRCCRRGCATDEAFLKRFRAEARSVASLNHPHVLRVFDWGEEADEPYLVMEYLGGGSLRDLLDRDVRLSHPQAAQLGAEVAQGLAYAHVRGLVHRDIKPANLLFDEEGRVRIADFGVARALAEAAWTEPAGAMVGTARYISPEAAEGKPVDGRADVYSLALVLYEAVTGTVPFVTDTTMGTLAARIGQTLPHDPLLGPLDDVLARAAAPDVAARLDAAGLSARLGALASALPTPAPLPLVFAHVERSAPIAGFTAPGVNELTETKVAADGRGRRGGRRRDQGRAGGDLRRRALQQLGDGDGGRDGDCGGRRHGHHGGERHAGGTGRGADAAPPVPGLGWRGRSAADLDHRGGRGRGRPAGGGPGGGLRDECVHGVAPDADAREPDGGAGPDGLGQGAHEPGRGKADQVDHGGVG